MNGYWTETRPNGKPIDEGTFCYVIEAPGINPVYYYGKTKDEVIDKVALNNAHAQTALARRNAPPASSTPPASSPAPKPRMTGDEVMRATQDLDNPATAGRAIAQLVEDATGIDLSKLALQNFGAMAMAWQSENPDFYPHPGNKNLLAERAARLAGGQLSRVTPEILSQAHAELSRQGLLFEDPAGNQLPAPNNLATFPDESPVQRIERPRGALFATGTRSTNYRAPQTTQPKTPKYTEEQIRTMPESKSRALIDANDKDYAEACEMYYGQQATA